MNYAIRRVSPSWVQIFFYITSKNLLYESHQNWGSTTNCDATFLLIVLCNFCLIFVLNQLVERNRMVYGFILEQILHPAARLQKIFCMQYTNKNNRSILHLDRQG
jgi:hypothetical protein